MFFAKTVSSSRDYRLQSHDILLVLDSRKRRKYLGCMTPLIGLRLVPNRLDPTGLIKKKNLAQTLLNKCVSLKTVIGTQF